MNAIAIVILAVCSAGLLCLVLGGIFAVCSKDQPGYPEKEYCATTAAWDREAPASPDISSPSPLLGEGRGEGSLQIPTDREFTDPLDSVLSVSSVNSVSLPKPSASPTLPNRF